MKTNCCSLSEAFLVKIGSRRQVAPSQILMLKADCNYTEIFLNDGSKFLSSTTLGTIAKRLEGFNFFRINRSTVINMKFIVRSDGFKECKPTEIRMQNVAGSFPDLMTISRRRINPFLALINN